MFDFTTKIILGLLLSALASSIGYSFYLRLEIKDRNETISAQSKSLTDNQVIIDRYVSNAKNTDAVIAQINKSLSELKQKQDEKEAQIREALANAEVITKQYESYSAELLATTPKSSNMCKEAEDIINSYLAKERSGK